VGAIILLVDDERDNLEPMRLMLEDSYRVLTAENGPQALALLEAEPVELIIADQRMPGMTGVELLARVHQIKPDVVRLILTAYSDFDAMLKAINEGRVYRYIIKPWDVDDMRLTIRQALEWRELLLAKGQLAADLSEAHGILAKRTRELEQAHQTIVRQEKLAAVGQFAAEMVHEMNNYLQIILGINANLAQNNQGELDQFRQIETQAITLAEVAADIRDFALGASMPFAPIKVDVLGQIREVVRICSHHPDFRERQVSVVPGRLEMIRLDPRQFRHLLLNLLKNAALSSPAVEPIEVRVDLRDETLELRVIDRGPGVAPAVRDRIFEPFFTTRSERGSGLGLSIARQVAAAHGGSLACEETPGGGATFVVRLPRIRPEGRSVT
jgi:signal transduction histidine kinase